MPPKLTKDVEAADDGGGDSNKNKESGGDSSAAGTAADTPPSDNVVTKENPAGLTPFKLTLLAAMVVQNSATVLITRYTRSGVPADDMYNISHLIFVSEVAKFVLSCLFEYVTTGGELVRNLRIHVWNRPLDAAKIAVPALLYLVQNNLLYLALSNLTAPIFQVTYQSKLVTTAIVSVVMLQRSYSIQQWICLVGISLGVAIVVLGEKKDDEDAQKNVNLVKGLVSVTIACMSSAFAGVYFEKVVKKPQASSSSSDDDSSKDPVPSVWMRNIQLAFYSLVIAYFQGGVEEDASGKPYLHGFGTWTWILVGFQAGGGMLVAAIIKYADNVLKGLATGVSVVLSSALSLVLFSTPLGFQFLVGSTLILTSVWFFSNHLPAFVKNKCSN